MQEREDYKEIESLNEKTFNIEELSPEDLEQASGGGCDTFSKDCSTFDSCGSFSGNCGAFSKEAEEM